MPFEVEPSPSLPAARFGAPEEAQEASYFAASARMRSFVASFSSISHERLSSCFVLARRVPIRQDRRSQLGCGAAARAVERALAAREPRRPSSLRLVAQRRDVGSERGELGKDALLASRRVRQLRRVPGGLLE